ncbi:MAG TPA: tRNA adenosine deaminase-associated protein [Mycobacteriales bacterium]|nr:tRNA adenosine deaminase-associated protein [Mycobacteriales bacterium]
MSYFAAALARTPGGWTAEELDLDGVSDVDEVADRVRDVDGDAETALLFVEEDDEYVAILRIDAGSDEPRVFVSDGLAAESYPVAGIFTGAVEDELPVPDDDEDAPPPDSEPVGDADLLADLGTPRRDLIALVTHERTLPADVISEVCERAGCLDELETLRGA